MARTEESGKAADLGCGMDFALEWRLDMIKRAEKHNPISGNRIDNPLDECQGNARQHGNQPTPRNQPAPVVDSTLGNGEGLSAR